MSFSCYTGGDSASTTPANEPPFTPPMPKRIDSISWLSKFRRPLVKNASVLISGLGPVGCEVAKSLIKAGVGTVTLHDTRVTLFSDLSAQYFLNFDDLNKNRAECCYKRLAKLKKSVKVNFKTHPLTKKDLVNYKVVILANSSHTEKTNISKWARELNICLLISDAHGLFAFVFADFGPKHEYYFEDEKSLFEGGKPFKQMFCDRITTEHDHNLKNGDYVMISDVEHYPFNGEEPKKIKVNTDREINYESHIEYYEVRYLNGKYWHVKGKCADSFLSWEDAMKSPKYVQNNYHRKGKLDDYHAIWSYLNLEDANTHMRAILGNSMDKIISETEIMKGVDEDLFKSMLQHSFSKLVFVASIVGGIVAQEAMKAITKCLKPVNQWLYLDFTDHMHGAIRDDTTPMERQQTLTQSDGIRVLFGTEFVKSLLKTKWIIVGADKIGCEVAKCMAMLGVRCLVSDNQYITRNNFRDSFLFRPRYEGGMKSDVVVVHARMMNNTCAWRILNNLEEVIPERTDFEAVLTTVNQLKIMIHGRVTSALANLDHIDIETIRPPLYTLKYAPTLWEHVTQWAFDMAMREFVVKPALAKYYLQTKNCEIKLDEETLRNKNAVDNYMMLCEFVKDIPTTMEGCDNYARRLFSLLFDQVISENNRKMAENPSSAHREPLTVLKLGDELVTHIRFLRAVSTLKAKIHCIQPTFDCDEVGNFPVVWHDRTKFTYDDQFKFPTNEAEAQANETVPKHLLEKMEAQLKNLEPHRNTPIEQLDFEDEGTYKIFEQVLKMAAEFRAQNYGIVHTETTDDFPVANTHSAIAGFMVMEAIRRFGIRLNKKRGENAA